jgi:hypothetical protein
MDYEVFQIALLPPTCACVSTAAPLVAQGFPTTSPYLFMRNVEGTETRNSMFSVFKNKDANEMTLQRLKGQLLVFRRVLVCSRF